MDFEFVSQYVKPELIVVGVFLFCLGMILKLHPGFKQEWSIPFILTGVSIVSTIPYMALVLKMGWGADVFISGVIQAIILVSLCVFANQLYKQITEKKSS